MDLKSYVLPSVTIFCPEQEIDTKAEENIIWRDREEVRLTFLKNFRPGLLVTETDLVRVSLYTRFYISVDFCWSNSSLRLVKIFLKADEDRPNLFRLAEIGDGVGDRIVVSKSQ